MHQPLKLLTIIGARPQIIKAAAISRAIADRFPDRISETILHTGQHYDANMSRVFFDELSIPAPDIDLGVGSGSHGVQTARMLEGIERVILDRRPDVVLLYGDTNSTLAGAVAASKLHVPVAHVEAGLRSFNKAMPEEINRILCDHCSTWLFCPTATAVQNLLNEGFPERTSGRPSADRPAVLLAGDVMYDNSLHYAKLAMQQSSLLKDLGLGADGFALVTIHRDNNTDDPKRLTAIMESLLAVHREHRLPLVLPLHPRTRKHIEGLPGPLRRALEEGAAIRLLPPAGFLDMIALESHARIVLTDSGGVQKEAHFFGKPCVILRPQTEWVELVEHGQAILADADPQRIQDAARELLSRRFQAMPALFGDGHAAEGICSELLAY